MTAMNDTDDTPISNYTRGAMIDDFGVGVAWAIWRAWRAVTGVVLKELEVRRAIAELSSAGEHMLHDMGLTRDDIDRVARHGRF
jgi:uncharacterized protein YjiS (DUF1127 family)